MSRRVTRVMAAAVGALFVFLVVVMAVSFSRKTGESAATPLMLKPAPEIDTDTYDGSRFLLSRRRGSWVVLNFFNSTCIPCKREHPELVRFFEAQQQMGAEGAEVYTVVNDDDENAVRAFFDENGGGWPILRDEYAEIAVDYGVAKVPETWIISPTGVVAQRFTGEITAELLGASIAAMTGEGG